MEDYVVYAVMVGVRFYVLDDADVVVPSDEDEKAEKLCTTSRCLR
ncbi:hypothetical protein TIFTF001_002313 [Ficus carica]|uniref:Uncharacterized protein n=1 Tax=Ficus carica TaxID=3494 RepID=A0AA88CS03_FICCA|nr:hypothetical protein TIFTF001_002313 [Ficus carica]